MKYSCVSNKTRIDCVNKVSIQDSFLYWGEVEPTLTSLTANVIPYNNMFMSLFSDIKSYVQIKVNDGILGSGFVNIHRNTYAMFCWCYLASASVFNYPGWQKNEWWVSECLMFNIAFTNFWSHIMMKDATYRRHVNHPIWNIILVQASQSSHFHSMLKARQRSDNSLSVSQVWPDPGLMLGLLLLNFDALPTLLTRATLTQEMGLASLTVWSARI